MGFPDTNLRLEDTQWRKRTKGRRATWEKKGIRADDCSDPLDVLATGCVFLTGPLPVSSAFRP